MFEELENLGFRDLESLELFKVKNLETGHLNNNIVKEINPVEILYDKTFSCTACFKDFKSKAIKTGKNRLLSVDDSLFATYSTLNPYYYDCIVCPHCGYAGIVKNANKLPSLTPKQKLWIQESISSKFHPHRYSDVLTPDEAIERYKLALLSSIIKKGKNGERAYICFKISWLYKEKKDSKKEKEFLGYALEGFKMAFSTESFPIFEYDEYTVSYLIAYICKTLEHYEEAMQWLGYILINKNVNPKLKDRAYDLKEAIKQLKQK